MFQRKRSTLAFASVWLLLERTVLSCPLTCQSCSLYKAECENVSSLSDVLVGLSNYIENIHLRNGNLSKIPQQSFTKFYKLRFLSITGFLVSALTNLTFATVHINNLRRLDLSHNHLLSCMIEPMAFSGLIFLDELILTNNSLDILRRSWFLEMPLLSKLFLGFNRILYLAPRTFESLAKLKELDISSNMIQYLPMDTFYGLPLLTRLDLSSNRILFINHEVFRPLQVLRYLLLFRNRLTILPLLPRSIVILFLHENPWNCSCQLANSMESLTDKIQTSTGVVCNNPPSLAGHQAMSAKPEGCASSSPPSSPIWRPSLSLSSSSSASAALSSHHTFEIVHLWLLCGILGGLFVGVTLCLICCFCLPRRCPCMFRKLHCWDPCTLRNVEWMRPPSQKPVLAPWDVDKIVDEIRVRQRESNEREMNVKSPTLNRWCCQRRSVQRSSECCRCVGACGAREHCFARGEEPGCPLQPATSHRMEGCVMGKPVETTLDGQRSAWLQSPSALIHVDCRDGKTVRIESEQATVCAASSKPCEPWRGAVHIGGPRSCSGSLSSSGKPLRCGTDSAARLCSKASLKRKHPRQSVESAGQPSSAGPYSKEYLSVSHEGLKKQKRTSSGNPGHLPFRGVTYSTLYSPSNQMEDNSIYPTRSPYIEMLSIGLRPLKKESFPQSSDHTPCSTQTDRECQVVRNEQEGVSSSSAGDRSTVGRFWSCRRCGYKENHPGVLRLRTQQACGNSGKMPSDATARLPSFDTGCNVDLTVLTLQAAENKPRTSRCMLTFQPSEPITSNPGLRESDRETGSIYPFGPDPATVALETELSQKVADMVFLPSRQKSVLTDQERTLHVREMAAEHATDTPSQESVVIGIEYPLDVPAGQNTAQGDTERISGSSGQEHVYSSVSLPLSSSETHFLLEPSEKSRSKVEPLGVKDDEGSITSSCPMLQKMCQVEFPFLVVEDEQNPLSYEDNGGGRD